MPPLRAPGNAHSSTPAELPPGTTDTSPPTDAASPSLSTPSPINAPHPDGAHLAAPNTPPTLELVGYDDLGGYTISSKITKIQDVISRLHANPSCRIIDLGGGNGYPASIIHQAIHPHHPVTCVDPMPAASPPFPGVHHVQQGALEYLRSLQPTPGQLAFDRVVMMSMVHHLRANLAESFGLLRQHLPPDGVVVIQTRGERCTLPLNPHAVKLFVRDTPTVADLVSTARATGFEATVEELGYPSAVPKQHYLGMIESRWISTLHGFSEQELQECRDYVDQQLFPGAETVEFVDKFFVLTLKCA